MPRDPSRQKLNKLALLLCLCMIPALAGCGNDADSSVSGASALAASAESEENASDTEEAFDAAAFESGSIDSSESGSDASDEDTSASDSFDTGSSDDNGSSDNGSSDKNSSKKKEAASSLTYKQKLKYIQNHKKQYPKRYRQLAKQYPETIDFVYNYPELHDQSAEIDLSEEAASASIPLLIQWDERWGYESYGDGDIGYTGCGPTCLSMVALYLTGNEKYTPLYIAKYADANGYYSEGSGTLWLLMTKGAKAFGLTASEVDTDEETLKQLVKSGCPVICSVGKGDFTDSGHFIVLTGYAKGKFTLHDPNSVENSEKTWSYKRLAKQIRSAWSYQAAGGTNGSGAAG